MLVDETGKQVTMTKFPRMALAKVELNAGNVSTLTLTAPGMPPINLIYPKPDGENERICQ